MEDSPQESENRTAQDSHPPKKISPNLVPFKAGESRTIELARRGGLRRSAEKRVQAMLSRARRRNTIAYADYADISPQAALTLMKVFLDYGRYRTFLTDEMFELLGATQGHYHYAMKGSTWFDKDGKPRVNHNDKERRRAIEMKIKVVELLLKAGRAFFHEMRESGPVQALQINIEKESKSNNLNQR